MTLTCPHCGGRIGKGGKHISLEEALARHIALTHVTRLSEARNLDKVPS